MNEEYTYAVDSDMRQFGRPGFGFGRPGFGFGRPGFGFGRPGFGFGFGRPGLDLAGLGLVMDSDGRLVFTADRFSEGLSGACRKRFIQSVLVRGLRLRLSVLLLTNQKGSSTGAFLYRPNVLTWRAKFGYYFILLP